MCIKKPAFAGAAALLLLAGAWLQGCAELDTKMAAFEAKAGPEVARACAAFRRAEASPLVQVAVAGGTMAANAALGGVPVAGLAVSAIKGFGDEFCAKGPPVGDATTPAERTQWLAGVTQQLIDTAAKVAASAK